MGGGGEGKKQSARHHPPTLKSSLSITNILLFFAGGVGKKVMRCQSLGVFALNEKKILFSVVFLQHNDNIILFV